MVLVVVVVIIVVVLVVVVVIIVVVLVVVVVMVVLVVVVVVVAVAVVVVVVNIYSKCWKKVIWKRGVGNITTGGASVSSKIESLCNSVTKDFIKCFNWLKCADSIVVASKGL